MIDKKRSDDLCLGVENAFNQKIEAVIDIHCEFMKNPDFDVRLECQSANDPRYEELKAFSDKIVELAESLLEKERIFRSTVCLAADEFRKEQ